MGHITTKLFSANDQTAATINSDPPFDVSFMRTGSVVIRCNNWGNADNTLVADVYWGVRKRGLLNNIANLVWERDMTLSKSIAASGGIAVPVAGVLAIPQAKSKFMKVVFTLAGTTREVDIEAWLEQIT